MHQSARGATPFRLLPIQTAELLDIDVRRHIETRGRGRAALNDRAHSSFIARWNTIRDVLTQALPGRDLPPLPYLSTRATVGVLLAYLGQMTEFCKLVMDETGATLLEAPIGGPEDR